MFDRVNKYYFRSFIDNFITLFITLFIIVSVIFFINIARVTSYVEITFLELFKLYSFLLPQILLFTVPISFFVALAISIFKLSKENESIVIFNLGKKPTQIAGFFLIISGILSLLLLLNALILMPYMQNLNAKFIEYKKTKFSLNIRPGEFGQTFGHWYVFAGASKTKLEYNNFVLYNPVVDGERLVLASGGRVQNINGALSLVLDSGEFYDIAPLKWRVGEYEKMIITSSIAASANEDFSLKSHLKSLITDKEKHKDFSIYTLIALFPLASVLFTFCLGFVVYRYERRTPYIGVFVVLFAYFALILALANKPFVAIPLVFLLCFISSLISFKLKVLNKF